MIKDELLIPKSVSVILLLAFFKRQGVIQNVIVIDVRFTKKRNNDLHITPKLKRFSNELH